MRIVIRKLLYLIPVLIVVSALSFFMLKLLPGDPAVNILGTSATPEAVAQVRHELGLDKPAIVQYFHYLNEVLHGNLGKSYQNGQPTTEALKQRLPVTIELLIYSQFLALLLSVPAAIFAATRPNGLFDRTTTTLSFGFLAVPNFIL